MIQNEGGWRGGAGEADIRRDYCFSFLQSIQTRPTADPPFIAQHLTNINMPVLFSSVIFKLTPEFG